MSTFMIVWAAGLCLAFLYAGWRKHSRTAAMKAFAARRGFRYLKDALPASLSITGTTFERATQISNTMDGHVGGLHIAVFDCRISSGAAAWRRTVIAAQTTQPVFRPTIPDLHGNPIPNPALAMYRDQSGAWTFYYRPSKVSFFPRQLTPIPELEAFVDSMAP